MSKAKLYASLVGAATIIAIILFVFFLIPPNSDDQKETETPKLRTDEDAFSYTPEPEQETSNNGIQLPSPSQNPMAFPENIQIGVHANSNINLEAFEESIDAKVDIVAVHIHWGNENKFPVEFAEEVLKRDATLMIFWNPMDYTKSANEQQSFYYPQILDGGWDEYIDEFVQASQEFNGQIIISPMEEVNGEWTFWSGEKNNYGTTAEYIDTFRYLHDKFEDVNHVDFAWVVNHTSVPKTQTNSISTYYPGDDYVDLIGINAFNFGDPWIEFDSLIQAPLQKVLKFDKPIYITSVASAEGLQKAEWISNFFSSRFFSEDLLRGFIWFNENKERDWTIWSDEDSLRVFKKGVQSIGL